MGKYSDRLRTETRPQISDTFAEGERRPEQVCALGSLWGEGLVQKRDSWVPPREAMLLDSELLPGESFSDRYPCSVGQCTAGLLHPGRMVVHLNDAHRFTFAQIADWLESIGL